MVDSTNSVMKNPGPGRFSFIKPEVPGIATLKKMAKHEPTTVIRLSDNGRRITIMDMMKGDNWLFDDLKKIRYMINHDSIKLMLMNAESQPSTLTAYLVDDDTASTIEFSDLVKRSGKDFKITAITTTGEQIETIKEIKVPDDDDADIKGYTYNGTTIGIVSAPENRKYFSPGPSAWDWFMDNKAIKDLFPSSVNPGWFAVLFVMGAVLGFLIGGIGGTFLGKLLLG